MNSNPVVSIDSQVVDIQSQLAKRASCIYRIVSTETKAWASELHEKHALNRTGFSDVQEVLGWFSVDLETVDTNI